jgi:hypothetical protein
MPKPSLKEPWNQLEIDIIKTLLAGHKEWRPDLAYPESHSDMQGAVRGLLRMFDVTRRTLPFELPLRPYATNVNFKVEDSRGGKVVTIDLAGGQTDELVKAIERTVMG